MLLCTSDIISFISNTSREYKYFYFNGSLSTTVYRKKTHTDQYLSFHSHHPISHKIAVVNTLNSAESICSMEQELEKVRNHIKKVLRNNGYPERILAARKRKKEDKKKDNDTPNAQ